MGEITMKLSMKARWILGVIAFCCFLGGCRISDMGGAVGTAFAPVTPPAGKHVVYFYRNSSIVGAAATFALKVDASEITEVTNGGYYPYVTEPGQHVIYLKRLASPSLIAAISEAVGYEECGRFTVEADSALYMRYKLNSLSGQASFEEVPPEEAMGELKKLKRFKDGVRKGLVP